MFDCFLKCIYREKHTIPIKINTHTHHYDELTYYISGNGTTQIEKTVHPYKGGTFAFYRAETVHDEINPEPCDTIWTHFKFHIDGITLKEGLFEDPHGELLPCLQKLRRVSFEQRKYRQKLTESCLAQTIITAAKLQQRETFFHTEINWQKILDYIDENSSGEIDFAALAARNHYSYDRFRHLFREHFGISPHSYLTNQRIEHAKRLLKNSAFSLTDIAYDCGFNNSSQFSNVFKKYMGITPGEYRAKEK